MTTQNSNQSLPATPRLLYSREDATYQLSISVRSLDYMIAGKKIASQRIGTRILIPHAELVRFVTTAQIRSVA